LLAQSGYDVAVLARGTDGVEGAVRDVQAVGRSGLGVPTDVSDWSQVSTAAERVERDLGPIDVWVNNAMASVFARFWEVDPDDFVRATQVTYLGQVNGTRAALHHMRPRNHGTIVNVGSALAYRGIPLQAAYCGAKHAVIGFTESVLTELRNEGSAITVSMVQMPGMNTPQFNWVRSALPHHPQPVPPIFQPEVGARAIVDIIEHPRRNAWVALSTAGTITGNRIFPGLLDRYLAKTGVKSQQTTKDSRPQIGDNLYSPVPGDSGAHGDFDARAHEGALWPGLRSTKVGFVAGVGAGIAAALAAVIRTARS
jgi:NAD(P)-dependent dehydrogenase (short-subunit alcohol dehydrogenase family)